MGKYNMAVNGATLTDTTGLDKGIQIVFGLQQIANELAEANRLKRLELIISRLDSYGIVDHDDLEDRA